MVTFFVSGSIALVLTALFTFRFRMWTRPRLVAAYFALFLALEWGAEALWLPAGALGLEVAYVCVGLSALFGVAILVVRRLEASQ